MGAEEYLERCTQRTRSVVTFSRSEDFYENILIGSLSSIPRWKYARKLEEINHVEGKSRTAEASAVILESTRSIIKGENFTVEHFINREPNQNKIRLSLYAALLRTALYLSEKNDFGIHGVSLPCFHKKIVPEIYTVTYSCFDVILTITWISHYIPYTAPLWMAARGSLPPEDAIKACREYSCCLATGMELKVFNSLGEVQGVEREVAEFSLKQSISALCTEYNKKGGCDNTEIERIFSLMTHGLREY